MTKKDISEINYSDAGVSLIAQNEVNARIKEELQKLGLNAEGLFGGAVDITHLIGQKSVPIGVVCSSIFKHGTPEEDGINITEKVFDRIEKGITPIALLDYYASPGMDVNEVPAFVRGVAIEGLEHKVPLIGGESAQMPGTYKKRKRDAYVHLIYHGNHQGTTIDIADLIRDMERPLLCASTDGTGTKTRIVRNPEDIIYHGGNDLGAIGVRPVAFALYVAGNAPIKELEAIVEKSQTICTTLGITALDPTIELKPEEYAADQVDIAGTVIGVIDEKDMITGKDLEVRDVIIGFATDCLMTNGYSLARKYLEMIDESRVGGLTKREIIKELSKPHTPYTDILFGNKDYEGILSKFEGKIKATAHITGGGQRDNIIRMVPKGLWPYVQKQVFPLPPIVEYFRDHAEDVGKAMRNMYETFNMGVGFTVTVSPEIAAEAVEYVNDNFRHSVEGVDRQAAIIGKIKPALRFVD